MKIYVAHSRDMDYINELYNPLRAESFFKAHELILPHENNNNCYNERNFYKNIDIIIAECSEPSTGLGIEIGWAYDDNKKIYCLYKKGKRYSDSIRLITNNFYEYSNSKEIIEIIREIINKET